MTKRGMKFDVVQGIDIAEFNYTPFVQQLKDKGVRSSSGPAPTSSRPGCARRCSRTATRPKLYLRDPTDYNPAYVELGGAAVDGTVVFTNFVPFEEAGHNPEMRNYLAYLDQVKPGATPQFFGVFAWSAARLFVKLATDLGGDLSRETADRGHQEGERLDLRGSHRPAAGRLEGHRRVLALHPAQRRPVEPVGGTKYTCNGLTSSN